jgi:putative hydrolase of the HAD superfamily
MPRGLQLDDVSCVLFDFFGTLVHYEPSRVVQGYPGAHAQFVAMGGELGYETFLARWDDVFARFDRRSDHDDSEFSMWDVGREFFTETTGRTPDEAALDRFIDVYLEEWSTGVRDIEGIAPMLAEIGARHRLAVVTNTHSPHLVPAHLRRMGIDGAFEAVVTSIEVGHRKPHPAIYAHTLSQLCLEPRRCVFVGDTVAADYIGPRAVGMHAVLVDPTNRHAAVHLDQIGHRVSSVLDVAQLV